MRRLAVVAVLAVAAAACGGTSASRPPATTPPVVVIGGDQARLAPAGGVFGAGSVWKADVRDAPVAADSAAKVKLLVSTITDRYGGLAAFNAHEFDTTLLVAPAGTRTYDLTFNDCQHRGQPPAGLLEQYADVPIPADAAVSPGTDAGFAVWSPSRDALWEFWEVVRTGDGWAACFGGRIDHVSSSPGYFTGGFGATASGLADVGGMVGIADVRSGTVDHALDLAIPLTRAGSFVYPAQRTDGVSDDPAALPEGARLRLPADLDVDALHLTPIATMIAKAAQRYGFVVTDTAGAVGVLAENPVPSKLVSGVDAWVALEQGVPDYAILQGFPWDRLQVLPDDWGKPAG